MLIGDSFLSIFEYIGDNKEWIFSGIGVFIISCVIFWGKKYTIIKNKGNSIQNNCEMHGINQIVSGDGNVINNNLSPNNIQVEKSVYKNSSLLSKYIENAIDNLVLTNRELKDSWRTGSQEWLKLIESAIIDDKWKDYIETTCLSTDEQITLKKWFKAVAELRKFINGSIMYDTHDIEKEINNIINNINIKNIKAKLQNCENFVRNNKDDNKRKIKEQQLEKIYCPIHREIMGFYKTNFYDEGYFGVDEYTVIEVIKIIQNNRHIADSALLDWQDKFESQLYESRNVIRPHNPDYDPLYDENKEFLKFVDSKIKKLRKDMCVD
ncbi:hypothetical protein SAMN02745671_02518 [Anaerovibrio lipolyticus DSM 3074]|uniref:Uncharacterized protein n=1 Tax=Anaerovibrio lipolyticus DSM 3074 TaxID=1120997 RepID=A0A1M6G4I4_9FIRM|nr:hypothetical protein SAMN02745671_02518 [Anaerovibrio lipolyticus DSM 3074]